MKILVLGKSGMLGHVVYNYFSEQGMEVIGTSREGTGIIYDAFKKISDLELIIKQERPDVVINCIGILNKDAENNKELAVKLNSLLPHYCDGLSSKYNFKFIHVSTDCVYEGTKGNYDEFALPDASSFYGRSKALGEIINNKNVTLRTSIIGPDINKDGIGLFKWFMNQTGQINGFDKVVWTGVTTIELTKAMEKAIQNNLTGLHHVVNNHSISKYELLKIIKEVFEKDIIISKEEITISEKTLIKTKCSFDFEIPTYRKMIEEMKEWIINHSELYPDLINQRKQGVGKK